MSVCSKSVSRLSLVAGTTLLCAAIWLGCEQSKPPVPAPNPVPVRQPPVVSPLVEPPIKPAEQTAQPPAASPAATNDQNKGDDSQKTKLFADWPEPQLVLFVTGQQQGYIEPCGCTGLANQKGGLARRHTLLTDLREKRGWNVVPVDVGSQSKRFGRQPEIKFQRTAEALRTMGYQAVTLGADDLRLTAGELTAATNPDDKPSIFVSANVAVLARDLQPTHVVVEAGGKKIGITGVLGDSHEQKLAGDELVHEPVAAALQKASDELKAKECDVYILLCHASLEETKKIAAAAPLFDLVVTAGGVGEPTLELEAIPGSKAKLVQVGTKGMYAGVIGVFATDKPDDKNRFRYERVPLDARWKDSPAMLQVLADYQQQLEQLGLEELGLKPQPHPSGRKFVSTEKCGECHTKAYAAWQETAHAHATDSLVKPPNERADIARHFDPECLSCHVTGWEPQKFFPFQSGYLSLKDTPRLQHNGCENCHGPGSDHVAAEDGSLKLDKDEIMNRRNAMKLPLAGGVAEKKCMECHDLDNSPDFHVKGAFDDYWKQVIHKGRY